MMNWLLATMPSGFVFDPRNRVVIVEQVGEQSTTLARIGDHVCLAQFDPCHHHGRDASRRPHAGGCGFREEPSHFQSPINQEPEDKNATPTLGLRREERSHFEVHTTKKKKKTMITM
jgi:hypothetical protein